MPERIDDCVQSVLDSNPDMDESTAYAICHDMDNKGQLSEQTLNQAPESFDPPGWMLADDDPCWEGFTMVGMKEENGEMVPNCVPDDEVPDANMAAPRGMSLTLSEIATQPIKRQASGDEVRYSAVKILAAGVWTDSGSGESVWYSPRGLQNLTLTDGATLNIMHDSDNEVSAAGRVENLQYSESERALFADLVIDTSTAAGEYADANLQKTLETNGAKGFGGPSVEIPADGQEIRKNSERGMKELTDGKIDGVGLVKNPASKPVSFPRQSASRGVALGEGQSHYRLDSERTTMSEGNPMEDPDEAREILDKYGFDGLDEMTDEDVVEMVNDLMGDLAPPEEDLENQDPDEDEDETPMDDMGEEMMEEWTAMKNRLDDLEDELAQMRDAALTESDKEELAAADTVEAVEARLSELENEPAQPRTMADSGGSDNEDFFSGRRMASTDTAGRTTR